MKILTLMITLLLTGCAYKVKESIKSNFFIDTYKLDTTKIRFDGFYLIDKPIFYTNVYNNYPVKEMSDLRIFNKNKNLYFTNGKINDYSRLSCEFYQEENKRFSKYDIKYPKYTIKNDSIFTYHDILITVGAGQRVPIWCNFRGYIKNKDTITDWKIIPPYPKDFTKSVKERNKDLFEPNILYFVKTDAVKCLKMD